MCSDMLHISKNLKNTLPKMLNENHFKQRSYSTFKNRYIGGPIQTEKRACKYTFLINK
jgi:hypothetical protein